MRKFLIATLMVKLVFLLVLCPPLSVLAESGSGGGVAEECAGDPTKYALDANGDEVVDLSDVIWSLSWLFSGGQVPRVCLDTTDLEANLATAEGERDAAQIAQATAEAAQATAEGERDAAEAAQVTAEGERDAAEAAQATAEAAQATAEAAQATAEGERDAALAALALAQAERDDALADLASCQDAPLLCGCTDSEALNYNPEATVDDGSCVESIPGFTFFATNTEGYDEYTHDVSGIRFVHLPGGEFEMGSPAGEAGRGSNEGPVHTVSLSPFLIAKYEVTQAEYEFVMTDPPAGLSATPSNATGDDLPVESVSLNDLKAADGFLGRTGLSLPSEAQWEYACRAGSTGPYAGNGILDDMGWYDGNSGGSSHDVGTKQANDFGLHDMHGNVFEWCEDVYSENFYASELAYGPDPVATSGSGFLILRGGSFSNLVSICRSAYRNNRNPTNRISRFGFRPAMPLP